MSNNIVFNSFLNLLVNKDPKYTKEYIYDINKFDVWFCARGKSFSANNILNNKLDKLFTELNKASTNKEPLLGNVYKTNKVGYWSINGKEDLDELFKDFYSRFEFNNEQN